jgi:NCAIR mutase (PurE)-related protein
LKQEKVFIDPFEDLGYAKVDLHRGARKGFPEVIFSQGKTTKQVIAIAENIVKASNMVLITRVTPKLARSIKSKFKKGRYHQEARIYFIGRKPKQQGMISILTGGTADIPVAEEARITAEVMGSRVKRFYDIGVAGIHRILSFRKEIDQARALIVVAGMDGVLASIAGGLFSKPIIAVPTSVGYGLNLQGMAPLLTMLNSCAPGIAVVNIDNGFGAGYFAALINKK